MGFAKYRRVVILIGALAVMFPAVAQYGCPGFKNPVTFLTGSPLFFWSGRVGERCYSNSSDTTNGYVIKSTCSSPNCPAIPANQLTSTVYNSGMDMFSCSNINSIWDNNDRRFQIITQANAGLDGYTVNPENPGGGLQRIPPGYMTSIRLGDLQATGSASTNCDYNAYSSNKGSEALFYTMQVGVDNALLIINYAVVTRKYNHTPMEAGEFCIRVVRQVNGVWETVPINDSLHYKVSAPAFSGALPSPWLNGVQGDAYGGYNCSFCYKPWTKVAINLSRYLYQTVRVEMYTSDCIYNVDPMMAYISGDYQSMSLRSSGCPDAETDIIDTVTALPDMISYKWFVSEIGAQQMLLNDAHMETIPFRQVFPENGGTTTQNYYTPRIRDFVLSDGPNAGDTVAEQTVMCIMTSALDPAKPFESRLYVNVKNLKPMMNPTATSDCNRTVTFNGNIFVYGMDFLDTSAVYWVVYSDATYTHPLDTLYGVNTAYTFSSAGDYGVLLHAQTLEHGCESVARLICTAYDNPPVGMNLSQHVLCEGDTLTLRCTEGMEYEKRWTVGNNIYSSTEGNLLNMLRLQVTPGLHEVKLETTNSAGCKSTEIDSIKVYGELKISVDGNKNAICIGDTVFLNASGNITYNWISEPHDRSLDGQEHQDSITVMPQQTTVYSLLLEDDNYCTNGNVSHKVEVWQYPEAVISSNRRRISFDNAIVRFIDSTEGSSSTLWRFSDGQTAEGKSVLHEYTLNNEDSVSVWMRSCNRIGCCDSARLSIPVGIYSLWFPNVFTPDMESNNYFGVVGTIPFEKYEIYIYNRNGLLVFSSTDPNEMWDGTDGRGNPCPQEAYVYYYRYKSDIDTYYHDGKGTVLLLR
ncbi:MAG: gliding motility-associated C-terminal domain-containing protein [Bacteroidales bacterium]|nr:gliding motility-associated C-terminal domain-containing protein [Bacteroidales bacterium]